MAESVHPLLGWIRGMCTDEIPHEVIDAKVAEAKEKAHALEAENTALRERARAAEQKVERAREALTSARSPSLPTRVERALAVLTEDTEQEGRAG